jgi:hypothetical protein
MIILILKDGEKTVLFSLNAFDDGDPPQPNGNKEEIRCCGDGASLLEFPYVCPEPVLVK